MTDTRNLTPEDGAKAIFSLMSDIGEATANGDLDGLEAILDRMETIVTRTGVEVPGVTDRIEAIKRQSRRARRHVENTDAALWAGDLERAEMLGFEDPGLDLAALHGAGGATHEPGDLAEAEIAVEPEDDLDDTGFDLSDFAASIGIEIEGFGAEEEDPYAHIAEGVPGAIKAFIASGADPNAPAGPSRHTPLLAALDAPRRWPGEIAKLIAAGADATVIHAEGDNAISWAMGYRHPETVAPEGERGIIDLLVAHGADVNHTVPGQMTALQRAIIQGGPVHVKALLDHGADPTVDMFENFQPAKLARATLIMQAAAKPEILRVLLDHGVDAARRDALGRAPLDFVREEAEAARARVDIDDEWTVDHAEALEISLGILERHLGV